MNRMIGYKEVVAALLAAAVMLLQACIADHNLCPEDLPGTQSVAMTLRLQLTSKSAASSATRTGGHEPQEATTDENYINIEGGDYRVMIFDGNGQFLQLFDVEETFHSVINDASGQTYTVDITGPVEIKAERLQVVVLANWRGVDSSANYPAPAIGDNISALYDRDSYSFTLPANWTPSSAAGRGIPMFGKSAIVDVSEAETVFNEELHADIKMLNLGDIKLLRSLAKIEVNAGSSLAAAGVSVTGAQLANYNTRGLYIPDVAANPDWNEDETQITEPTLPGQMQAASEPLTFSLMGGVMCAYVPEADLEALATKPSMSLTIKERDVETTLQYDNIAIGNVDRLLRNHIYRYTVQSVKADAALTVTAVPWERVNVGIMDFENLIGYDSNGYIQWEADTYLQNITNENENEYTLVVKNTTPAAGHFTLLSPLGADWFAFLDHLSGDTDAFKFVDREGNDLEDDDSDIVGLTYTTGKIDGQRIDFYIAPTRTSGLTQNNVATLRIMVRTLDGRWLEAKLCHEGSDANYKIQQNQL